MTATSPNPNHDTASEIRPRSVVKATMLVLLLLIGLPVLAGFLLNLLPPTRDGFDFWGPVIAILVAVTSMSVSGVFVFMSFRIDRGVKNETRETVRDVLINEMTDIFKRAGEDARDRFNDAKKSSDSKTRCVRDTHQGCRRIR